MVDSSFVSALAYAYARARAITWAVISYWVGALARAYYRAFIRDRG